MVLEPDSIYSRFNWLSDKKREEEIEAIQWDGENDTLNELAKFIGKNISLDIYSQFTITTLEGDMKASLFDYIIKGIKGEFYPCKPDIFEATYELIEE